MAGFTIYHGPSLLDGAPIVAVAITTSSNRKTGNMVQTYILRDDVAPSQALRDGRDVSICGDCKHRPILGGACYVNVGHGPRVVWEAWNRGNYPLRDTDGARAALGIGRVVRLGSYGDPAAVPAEVWESLTRYATGHTGYTHQWANTELSIEHRRAILRLCMASVDNEYEASEARAQGLRYFRVRSATETLAPREFECPASAEQGKRLTCATCKACSGTQEYGKGASVAIIVHGAKAKRFIPLREAT